MALTRLADRLRMILVLSETVEVARRYVALNIFDGVMIGLGGMLGFFLTGLAEIRVVVITTLAITSASAVSGFMGAFMSEQIEQEIRIRRLEAATLRRLRGSLHYSASLVSPLMIGLINSSSSALGILMVMAPYILASYGLMGLTLGAFLSLTTAMALFAALGYYMGRRIEKRIPLTILRTVGAGIAALLLILLIELVVPL